MPEELKKTGTSPETYERLKALGWYYDGRNVSWKFWWSREQKALSRERERERD